MNASMDRDVNQDGVAVAEPTVVVCIPTYRRAAQLARLLVALHRQRAVAPFAIVVGNNEDRDLATYPELADAALPPYRVIGVTTRGVSAVRNAMIADVLARYEGVRWIACLDDDQQPADDWLAALLRAGERQDADLVGGPVTRMTATRTFWSAIAADTSYLPSEPGLVPMLNEAGNLLLSARFLRTLARAPFSLDFGRTGGEDYEFFLHAKSRGARIVWAPEARVHEPMPGDRLTFRSYVWRFYAIAAYQARADRSYLGVRYVLRSIAATVVKAPVVLLRSLVRPQLQQGGRDRRAIQCDGGGPHRRSRRHPRGALRQRGILTGNAGRPARGSNVMSIKSRN